MVPAFSLPKSILTNPHPSTIYIVVVCAAHTLCKRRFAGKYLKNREKFFKAPTLPRH